MKRISSKLVSGVLALLLPCYTWADAPAGVGSADLSSGSCRGEIVVGPEGNFLPFLDGVHGVLNIELGHAKAVFANSANGNRNVTCHGSITPGDVVVGIDVVTGALASGVVAERADACSAIVAYGFDNPCRGTGEQSAIIIGPEFRGLPCFIDGVATFHWKSVFNSGGYMLSCHSKD